MAAQVRLLILDLLASKSVSTAASTQWLALAPAGFQYPEKTEAWLPPLKLAPELNESIEPTERRGMGTSSPSRCSSRGDGGPGYSEMETITARLRQQYPESNNLRFNRVVSLDDHLLGDSRKDAMAVIWRSDVCVADCLCQRRELVAGACGWEAEGDGYSIHCTRRRSRLRVIRQLLTESADLTRRGRAWIVAVRMGRLLLITSRLPDLPRISNVRIDWRALGLPVRR